MRRHDGGGEQSRPQGRSPGNGARRARRLACVQPHCSTSPAGHCAGRVDLAPPCRAGVRAPAFRGPL
ncbi:hypothetical protein AX27061_3901 [Achromobacter xylosoxidans NBRC 15126 = ATCC 27061]|nr:hypothetical protein AX27061_3901 [Achromobacter xylosoxidans NBRC 15126 = ATCC 27061]